MLRRHARLHRPHGHADTDLGGATHSDDVAPRAAQVLLEEGQQRPHQPELFTSRAPHPRSRGKASRDVR
eukprot:1114158-Pyramimonas_sp.AAC.1